MEHFFPENPLKGGNLPGLIPVSGVPIFIRRMLFIHEAHIKIASCSFSLPLASLSMQERAIPGTPV